MQEVAFYGVRSSLLHAQKLLLANSYTKQYATIYIIH